MIAPKTQSTQEIESNQKKAAVSYKKEEKMTIKQADFIKLLGGQADEKMSKGQASYFIGLLKSGLSEKGQKDFISQVHAIAAYAEEV